MGFFNFDNKLKRAKNNIKFSLDLLHKYQCSVCPLKKEWPKLVHYKLEAHGSADPVIYMLGGAPNKERSIQDSLCIENAGQILQRQAQDYSSYIRWGSVIRCRTPKGRTPEPMEVASCEPFLIKDIKQTKPSAIFGFGNIPLHWAIGQNGITKWRGRKIPITIEGHTCWFFPMLHPIHVNQTNYGYGPSEEEFAFELDLARAFNQVYEGLEDPIVHTKEQALEGVRFIDSHSPGALNDVIDTLKRTAHKKVVGFDYETNCIRPYKTGAKILTIAIATNDEACAFPLDHPQANWSDAARHDIIVAWRAFLKAPCRKVAHQLAFELEWSAVMFGNECITAGTWGDTVTQAWVIDERKHCSSLDFLCLQNFGLNLKAISNLDRNKLSEADMDAVLRYNALDAKYHRLLYINQNKTINEEQLNVAYRHMLNRIPTMVLTQIKGVPINQSVVKKFNNKYIKYLETTERKIAALNISKKFEQIFKYSYRPSAPKDTKLVLTRILKHEVDNVTESVLEKIKHPIIQLTLKWRKTNKLNSTYILPVMDGSPHLYPDGMIHPTLSTTKTDTSRTSSDAPNSQNYPRKNNKIIRSVVRPGNDIKLVAFDYAGIQARAIAWESQDEALIESFWHHYDVHSDWMEVLAQQYPAWVKEGVGALKDKGIRKIYRDKAKNKFVFPSFFGAKPKSISKNLNIPEPYIERVQYKLWVRFPEIHKWHKKIIADYKELGYVEGLSGIRRRAPISPNVLINAPIQADEALIVCDAMRRLSELGVQANFEIHDSLEFLLHKNEIDKTVEVITKEMTRIAFPWISTPLDIEMSVGDDWGHMEQVAVFSSTELWGHKK